MRPPTREPIKPAQYKQACQICKKPAELQIGQSGRGLGLAGAGKGEAARAPGGLEAARRLSFPHRLR